MGLPHGFPNALRNLSSNMAGDCAKKILTTLWNREVAWAVDTITPRRCLKQIEAGRFTKALQAMKQSGHHLEQCWMEKDEGGIRLNTC